MLIEKGWGNSIYKIDYANVKFLFEKLGICTRYQQVANTNCWKNIWQSHNNEVEIMIVNI